MPTLSVTEALATRCSTREFTDQPVSEDLLREVLTLSSKAPSGSNIQPWKVHALTGSALEQVLESIGQKVFSGEMEEPEFPTYPPGMSEPYRGRRSACAELMYQALEISREDKGKRIEQVLKNFQFFGAPVGIIITMDRVMGEAQALDIGIFAQTLMLLARERGLDSCPQLSWTMWPNAIREALDLNQNEKVMMGISLGYAEASRAVNDIEQPRIALEEFASIRGYQDQKL